MRIVVTGGAGQLGRALVRRGPAAGHEIVALDRAALDITDGAQLARVLARAAPDAVINAAAYTAVDAAERAPDAAHAVNATAAGQVAAAGVRAGARVLHVSTDHVFDGARAAAYDEDDPVRPINAYGASKAAGEALVRAAGGCVVRTSWLFAAGGNGFVQRILARARREAAIDVAADQHGCPTWADDLADALLALAGRPALPDVIHWCGAPAVSRHAFAREIVRAAGLPTRVEPVATAGGAPRPGHVVLATRCAAALGVPPRPWQRGLLATVREAT